MEQLIHSANSAEKIAFQILIRKSQAYAIDF